MMRTVNSKTKKFTLNCIHGNRGFLCASNKHSARPASLRILTRFVAVGSVLWCRCSVRLAIAVWTSSVAKWSCFDCHPPAGTYRPSRGGRCGLWLEGGGDPAGGRLRPCRRPAAWTVAWRRRGSRPDALRCRPADAATAVPVCRPRLPSPPRHAPSRGVLDPWQSPRFVMAARQSGGC